MKFTKILLPLAILFPLQAQAVSVSDIGVQNCSGNLSISIFDTVSYVCSGDLSLLDGSLTSDQKVFISANGNVAIDNMDIAAPVIEIYSSVGKILFGSGLVLSADNLAVGSNSGIDTSISIYAGATITTGDGSLSKVYGTGQVYSNNINLLTTGATLEVAPIPLPLPAFLLLSGLLPISLVGYRRSKVSA